MVIPTLDSMTPMLDRTCADVLGDSIQYSADGTADVPAFTAIQAHVNYADMAKSFEGSTAIVQDISVSIVKTDVTGKPTKAARITLPKVPGHKFQPINVGTSESGTHWQFDLKDVRNV